MATDTTQTTPAIRDRIKELRRVPACELKPNPKNWRKHPTAQREALGAVLREVGIADALIARELDGGTLELIDGHLRQDLTSEQLVPVLVLDVSEHEADTLLATLDPITEMAEASKAKLGELIAGQSTDDEGMANLLADLADKYELAAKDAEAHDIPEDNPKVERAAELQREWETELGQVWEIPGKGGEHRLVVGDCTDSQVVDRLGLSFDLCLTDPPYGADIQYDTHTDTKAALEALIAGFFPIAADRCKVLALTPGNDNAFMYPPPAWMLCWFYGAGTGRTPWGFTAWQPFLVYGACPKLAAGEGCHPDGFQYLMSREDAAENKELGHVCPKPLSVWVRFMRRLTSAKTRTVYDPFMGSGTTMAAAEHLGISALGCEISPAYAAVVLQRMKDAGLHPYRND